MGFMLGGIKMTEIKTTIEVKNILQDGKALLTDEGELEVAEKLNWYNFTLGKEYDVTIQDNTIVYARLSDEQREKDQANKQAEGKSQDNSRNTFNDTKYDEIIAQVCLKVAGNISKDVEEVKTNTKELFTWFKGGSWK